MKAAILTFHRAHNYGAVLQCYALNKALSKENIECVTVDYWPEIFKTIYYYEAKPSLSLKFLKKFIRCVQLRNILKKRNSAFENFIESRIPLTDKTYYNKSELKKKELDFDVFITGSDQVWNDRCAAFDPVYFLDFDAANNAKKYSYAASFGFKSIPEKLIDEYKRRLSGFEAYSVRESQGKNIIKNLLEKEAIQCCDPTLLLDKEEWLELGDGTAQEEYILMYYVTSPNTLRKIAMEIAKIKKCKVIAIPCQISYQGLSGKMDRRCGFEVKNCCGPEEFISLFANARYVLTNSFHGTVFSLIFHKKFLVQTELDVGKQNDRAKSLLEIANLENRTLENNEIDIEENIDWEDVDSRLNMLRSESINYIKSIGRNA